jgi:Mg2+ and Co2+ transporter CorA
MDRPMPRVTPPTLGMVAAAADWVQESLLQGGGGRMDVRLVSDEAIEQHSVGELERLLARDDGLVWVDIPVCDEEAAQVLREVFGFHPLAVQACIERNAVPKVRAYRDHIFVILHAPELGTGGHVHYVELDQFIGPRYVVTVHGPVNPAVTPEAALRETHAVRERIQAGRLRPQSAFELSYAIVSAMAQGQEAFVETVTRQVWPLEQRVTSGHLGDPEQFLEELFGTRHALLAVSNMAALGHQTYQRSAPPTGRPGRGRPPHRVRQGALRRHGRTGKSGIPAHRQHDHIGWESEAGVSRYRDWRGVRATGLSLAVSPFGRGRSPTQQSPVGCLGATSTALVLVATDGRCCGQMSQRLRATNGSLAHRLPRPQVWPA